MWKYVIPAMMLATPIEAQNCRPRAQFINYLAQDFGETRQSIGLGANNRVVEVFASLETGTWTIVVTMPNGMSCLVASGQAFELVKAELEPTGAPL